MPIYPDEYGELFQLAHEHGEFIVPTSEPQEARRLRGNLYAYRYHLRRMNSPLHKFADDIEMSIDGSTLILKLRTPIGVDAVRAALKEASR